MLLEGFSLTVSCREMMRTKNTCPDTAQTQTT